MTQHAPDRDADVAPPPLIARYANLLGTEVHITPSPANADFYAWDCQGCYHGNEHVTTLHSASEAANAHAGQCRALPRTEGA